MSKPVNPLAPGAVANPFLPASLAPMSNLMALMGGSGGAGSTSVQDILDKAAPGLGFLPAFIRTWLKIDISQLIGMLSVVGAMSQGVQFLERVAVKLYWWMTKFCTASVSISASDRLNREVLNWLGAKVLERQGTRILNARSEKVQNDAWYYREKLERNDYMHEKRRPVEYLPTFGTTWFVHRLNIFMVRRVPNPRSHRGAFNEMPDEYAAAPEGNEPLVVMCLGRSAAPIKRFLEDCREFSDKQREAFITVRASKGQYHSWTWDTTILRPIRPIETVHFDESIKSDLVRDIQNYLQLSTRQFYNQRGIPYRRGYLLHGPPGTGKTSLSLALAGLFGLELYLLHVPSMSSDRELETLFTLLPPRCIVLLEDIDAVGVKRTSAKDDDDDDDGDDDEDEEEKEERHGPPPRTSLSGLLNVLDGVASQEGRIVFMTSNFAEKLDAALVRPGRIDRMIFLGPINRESARLMFARMYRSSKTLEAEQQAQTTAPLEPSSDLPEEPRITTVVDIEPEKLAQLAVEFSENLPDNTFTPATLQGYLLNYRDDPAKAASGIASWAAAEIAKAEEAKAIAKKARERRLRKKKEKQLKLLKDVASAANVNAAAAAAAGLSRKDLESVEDVEAAVAKAMKNLKKIKEKEKKEKEEEEKKAKEEAAEEGGDDDGDKEAEEKVEDDKVAAAEANGDRSGDKAAAEENDEAVVVEVDESEAEGEYTTSTSKAPPTEASVPKSAVNTNGTKTLKVNGVDKNKGAKPMAVER